MKKCLIVYYSYHHGNTEKVAYAMAEVTNAKLCTVDNVNEKNLQDFEIIGFGAGIANGKHYDSCLMRRASLTFAAKPSLYSPQVAPAVSNITMRSLSC